ncbi:Ig-like domain-containing protein [Geoalkalibacter halelectricus]|uniref:Ig-like domain-containing protein n=1 Tax=Geoalkalibacter halelectricus TaxID=2847045 RepID=UPI003D1A099C
MVTFFVILALAMAGCGEIDSSSDGGGPDPGGDDNQGITTPSVATLGISANKFTVNTNATDLVTLTLIAKNAANAAVPNAQVNLSASAGMLGAGTVTTNEAGEAQVTFRAGDEKRVQVATITASSTGASREIPISIVGTTINLQTNKSSIAANGVDAATLSGSAVDAGGQPVRNAQVTLTSQLGNVLTAPGGSPSGSSITFNTSGTTGNFTATFSGTVTGEDVVTISGLGVERSVSINVSNETFGFVSPASQSIFATGEAGIELVVRWLNEQGLPVNGGSLSFAAMAGTFTVSGTNQVNATTNAQGEATVSFNAPANAAPVTIDVNAVGGFSDSIVLDVRAQNPSRIDLQAFPTAIAPSVGDVSSTATIRATVRDENNQAVQGKLVTFQLFDGPGGGETLSPITVLTDESGIATTTFTSGGASSAQNGVVIRATVEGLEGVFGEAKLTIGQQAARIVFGTTNVISVESSDGLAVAYALPVTVLVTDNNGNAMVNQEVNLGIYPRFFHTGFWLDNNTNLSTGFFANEDKNRNGILDPDEDGAIGYLYTSLILDDSGNIIGVTDRVPAYYLDAGDYLPMDPADEPLPPLGNDDPDLNGRLDPGNVASIPLSVTTDENGLAAFQVVYPKSYGGWVNVELQAGTIVSGSEARAILLKGLDYLLNDIPRIPSPFGTGVLSGP